MIEKKYMLLQVEYGNVRNTFVLKFKYFIPNFCLHNNNPDKSAEKQH